MGAEYKGGNYPKTLGGIEEVERGKERIEELENLEEEKGSDGKKDENGKKAIEDVTTSKSGSKNSKLKGDSKKSGAAGKESKDDKKDSKDDKKDSKDDKKDSKDDKKDDIKKDAAIGSGKKEDKKEDTKEDKKEEKKGKKNFEKITDIDDRGFALDETDLPGGSPTIGGSGDASGNEKSKAKKKVREKS
jgi:hypothetical protein